MMYNDISGTSTVFSQSSLKLTTHQKRKNFFGDLILYQMTKDMNLGILCERVK